MRLIEVNTFEMRDFSRLELIPEYAILSHRWGKDEVEYKDFQKLDKAGKMKGFSKIQGLYTCCIDKSSSSEYDEAISSMFQWYTDAKICYVYLFDVSVPVSDATLQDSETQSSASGLDWSAFEKSDWWRRGWTLQELIAPWHVRFFDQNWEFIGALVSMIDRVSQISKIPKGILDHSLRPSDFSIAQQLSWASMRTTTLPEDEAYALFGILDVNMTPVRNEGRRAFLRLQEHLIARTTDQTIFAWDVPQPGSGLEHNPSEQLLAPSPSYFFNGSRICRRTDTPVEAKYQLNNKGLEIKLPIIRTLHREGQPSYTLGVLDCQDEESSQTFALIMSPHPTHGDSSLEYYVSGSCATQGGRKIYSRLSQVSERALSEEAKDITITKFTAPSKDLQSQKYMKASSSNGASWFAIRFRPNELSQRPTLRGYFPRGCWHAISETLRLHPREYPLGGVVVDLPDGRSALIGFRATTGSSSDLCDLAFIDPACQIEPHLANLPAQRSQPGVLHAKSLRLTEAELLYVLLEHGRLIISVERGTDGSNSKYAGASAGLPDMSQKEMYRSTPNGRRRSGQDVESSARRNSIRGDRQTSRAQQWQATGSSYDYSPDCGNCQAKQDGDARERQRMADEEYFRQQRENRRQVEQQAARRQEGTRRRSSQTAKDLVAGGTLGGTLASIMVRRSGDSSDED
ncbi:hypothetical protein LTR10_007423 [Elasticomyces elasticus]|nr:hypothetical protein LTR10_007423 [Elasticomyces elasticus]KAK4979232.1 hypothetical protein LTR42_001735 [Elasticomyces elasticus]